MNRLVLLDGNAIMHRAYHALPPMTTPDGRPVNVVYGFVSMVFKLYDQLKPTHMAVAFDRPGPTFRNVLFREYQSHRPKVEDDFVSQIALVHDMVSAFGIPAYELDGFEADDVIGTIATRAARKGKRAPGKAKTDEENIDQVVIATGDRDILQLVEDEIVLVYMPVKGISEGKLYGEKEVVERMGLAPKFIVDLKALMGDASDNYPGVAGIGPKTAAHLLKLYGSLEGIYHHVHHGAFDMGEATKAKLVAGEQSAFLGKKLATIRLDAPVSFDLKNARLATLDTPHARAAIEAFRFRSLAKRLSGGAVRVGNEKQVAGTETKDHATQALQQELF